jgi:hypothetical protein
MAQIHKIFYSLIIFLSLFVFATDGGKSFFKLFQIFFYILYTYFIIFLVTFLFILFSSIFHHQVLFLATIGLSVQNTFACIPDVKYAKMVIVNVSKHKVEKYFFCIFSTIKGIINYFKKLV